MQKSASVYGDRYNKPRCVYIIEDDKNKKCGFNQKLRRGEIYGVGIGKRAKTIGIRLRPQPYARFYSRQQYHSDHQKGYSQNRRT